MERLKNLPTQDRYLVFQFTLHVMERQIATYFLYRSFMFQFTLHVMERQRRVKTPEKVMIVSIHAPRNGATVS